MIVAAVEKLPLDAAVRDAGRGGAARGGGPAERHRPRRRPPSAWSSWPTPTRPSGTPRRRWTGRTGPPTTAGTSPSAEDGAGGVRLRGRGTVEDAALLKAALLPLTKPQPAVDVDDPDCEVVQDPRDHGARMWDALVPWPASTRWPPTCPPTATAPGPGSPSPPVPGRAPAADRLGHPRQLGVDHRRRPRARPLGGPAAGLRRRHHPRRPRRPGEVLDVGRLHRLVTPPLWRAVVCRDQHCAFPGCTRPPMMCHAHHIVHWAAGGETKLENLVLLCGQHHRVIHHTPWQVRINPHDGRPEFLPPPKTRTPTTRLDPKQTPTRVSRSTPEPLVRHLTLDCASPDERDRGSRRSPCSGAG